MQLFIFCHLSSLYTVPTQSDQQQQPTSGQTGGADAPPGYAVIDPNPQGPISPTPTDVSCSVPSTQPIGNEAKKALEKTNEAVGDPTEP